MNKPSIKKKYWIEHLADFFYLCSLENSFKVGIPFKSEIAARLELIKKQKELKNEMP